MRAKFVNINEFEVLKGPSEEEVKKLMDKIIPLKPYERANRWLIPMFTQNERGFVDHLYYWGTITDNWVRYDDNSGEFSIDKFLCNDLQIAIELIAENYAILQSFDKNKGEVILLMKREY